MKHSIWWYLNAPMWYWRFRFKLWLLRIDTWRICRKLDKM